jgi:hypothetical protein
VSVPPPAGKGTIKVMCFCGQSLAMEGDASVNALTAASNARRVIFFICVSSFFK